jgi:hypothetical protein
MVNQEPHNILIAHVGSPVQSTSILLVAGIHHTALTKEKLSHLQRQHESLYVMWLLSAVKAKFTVSLQKSGFEHQQEKLNNEISDLRSLKLIVK